MIAVPAVLGAIAVIHFAVVRRRRSFFDVQVMTDRVASGIWQQQREIGVRMALGADAAGVRRLVVGRGLRLTAAGIAVGLALAWIGARAAAALLFEVSAGDPLTFAGAPALLLATACLACWVPARRATRIDPVIALRSE